MPASAVLSDLEEPAPALGAGDPGDAARVAEVALRAARSAQANWAATPVAQRLRVVRRFRHRLAERPDDFTLAVDVPQRRDETETLCGEVLPLADACRFLELEAERLLAPRTLGRRGRPAWMTTVEIAEHREPLGVVLILGTWNYPLFLPGVQAIQALVAGNAVLLKPGRNSSAAAEALRNGIVACGLDPRLLAVLPESTAAAEAAIDAGVDKAVLTGAAGTGRKVLARLSETLTPAAMELSGCDAVFVRGDADLDLAATCLALGMTFNGSATCVAPRRVFVHRTAAADLEAKLAAAFGAIGPIPVDPRTSDDLEDLVADALRRGARLVAGRIDRDGPRSAATPILLADASPEADLLKADVFAPVLSLVPVTNDAEALRLDAKCPYALGATVFGGRDASLELAAKVDAGCVVVNDFLIPTADPRVAFGGRRQSGYGVTRGAAGLLGMTQPKTLIRQTATWRPHLDPPHPTDPEFFRHYLRATHSPRLGDRIAGWVGFLREAYRRRGAGPAAAAESDSDRC